jgi:DNA replication and repair protein RecF
MVAVRRITLEAFRNYPRLTLACDAAPVVLIGENGAGKTNCLEAISLLAPGRGLRQAKINELQNGEQASGWAAAFECEGFQGAAHIGLGRDPENPDKRLIRIDGKTARGQTALAQHMAVLWLTPDMDRLLAESLSERRRFMDRMVYALHPDHLTHINRFDEAMRERNRLLQDNSSDDSWLSALEDAMARDGVAIAAGRLHWLQALMPFLQHDFAPFPNLSIRLDGITEEKTQNAAAVDVEDFLRAQWKQERRADRENGTTRTGPHRTGLLVTHSLTNNLAEVCSTGEQKALIIRLVMAQANLLRELKKQTPLLLLDDIMAHLDERRRTALAERILDLKAQAWLSGTESAFFEGFSGKAAYLRVRNAEIAPLDA